MAFNKRFNLLFLVVIFIFKERLMHDRPLEPISPVSSSPEPVRNAAFHKRIQLLEERLRVNLRKRKVGDVILRKEVETQIVEIPIRREKIIVEQLGSERRQLASIDIGKTEFTEDEIAALINRAEDTIDQPVQEPAISIQAAHQVLTEVLSRPGYHHTNIRLSFEDPQLQSTYQQWLRRHLGNA
jgi:preprotein translocase subunit SecD